MKYTGTLLVFTSSFGSVYNIVTNDRKCSVWKSNIVADISEKVLKVSSNFDRYVYDITASELKDNYYTGTIYCDREPVGSIFLWAYSSSNGLFLKGNYKEDNIDYDCFLELRSFP